MAGALVCEFFVAGLARAQPRAQRGKGSHVIMAPAEHGIHKWREGVRFEAQRAMAGRLPATVPVRLDVCFLMPRPKVKLEAKWRPDTHETPHEKDPDVDNLLKALQDALKMVTWSDDNLVSWVNARKRYTTAGEPPGVYVRIALDPVREWTPRLLEAIRRLAGVPG